MEHQAAPASHREDVIIAGCVSLDLRAAPQVPSSTAGDRMIRGTPAPTT